MRIILTKINTTLWQLNQNIFFVGQDVDQRHDLMGCGAVWGHGSQRGSDFSATPLPIVADAVGDYLAKEDS